MNPQPWQQLPLTGPVLLEASAGTGKTYTIALLYVRLLIELEALDIRQILVVTFTEAATAELRERLRLRLADAERLLGALAAGQLLPNDDPLAAWLQERAFSRAQAERLAWRLEAARLDFDQAAIFTIHGFCARALNEFGFSARQRLQRGCQLDEPVLAKEILRDFWRRQIERPESWVARVLGNYPEGPESLWPQVQAALNQAAARLLPLAADDPAATRFEALFSALASAPMQAQLAALLAAPAAEYQIKKDPLLALQALGKILAAGDRSAPIGSALASAVLGNIQKLRPAPKRTLEKFDCLALVAELADADAERTRVGEAWLLHEAISRLRAELRLRSAEVPGFTFNDLIADVHQALADASDGRLGSTLFQRWPVALIDEFQDTDARQFAIFRRIYADGGRGLLALIGDAKQAIYAFRGGDVRVCLAAGQLPGQHRLALGVNYRSDARLIAAVNLLFERAGADTVFETAALTFVPAEAATTAPVAARATPFEWLLLAPASDRKISKDGCRLAALEATADDIAATLQAHPRLRASQLAVLVSSNRDITDLSRALGRRGIAVAAELQQSVFASRAADSLLVLLMALAETENSARLRAALVGPWLGWSEAAVQTLEADDQRWSALLHEFQQARQRWHRHGPAAALLPWLRAASARLLATPSGERWLTDARHLLELLQAKAASRPAISAQLAWLMDEQSRASGPNIERQLRLQSDGDRVRVLTLHRAKGLEFDQVWLPLLWQNARPPETSGISIAHVDDELVIDTGGPMIEAHRAQAMSEREAEAVRLLYVGLTRARQRMVVLWVDGVSGAAGALGRVLGKIAVGAQVAEPSARAGIELLAALAQSPFQLRSDWPLPCSLSAAAAAALSMAPTAVALPTPRPLRSLHSFTRLLERAGEPDAAESGAFLRTDEPWRVSASDANEAITGSAAHAELCLLARVAGAGFGSALHGLLEQALQDGGAQIDESAIRRALEAHGIYSFDADWIQAVARLLDRCLHTELAPGLTLAGLPSADRVCEFGFELPLEAVSVNALEGVLGAHGFAIDIGTGPPLSGFLTGSADLIFVSAGRYYLVDYKSNALGLTLDDYAPAALDDAMREHRYALQYLLYSVALQRYLKRRIGASYCYAEHFGGVYYLFLRGLGLAPGSGIHFTLPPALLIEQLDQLFEAPGGLP